MDKDPKGGNEGKGSENIPKELRDLLKDIPEEQRGEVTQRLIVTSQRLTAFHGPLPPPEVLKEYQSILPGSPDRFLKLVEKEQEHTHSSEKMIIRNQIWQNWAGLIIGAILVVLFFVGAYKLALAGHDTVAYIIFSVTIISIATIFVLHKRSDKSMKKEDEEHDLPKEQ